MEVININTLEDALDALSRIRGLDDSVDVPEVRFGELMGSLRIHFEGPMYHGSLPSGAIRGLWEYQQKLYKGLAYVIYGVEDIRKLTPPQLKHFELNFLVKDGTTTTEAIIEKLIEGLTEWMGGMDSKDKRAVIIAIALCIVVGIPASQIIPAYKDAKLEEIAATSLAERDSIQLEQLKVIEKARTEQLMSVVGLVEENDRLKRFSELNAEGSHSLIKYSSELDSISIGSASFSNFEIEEIKSRSPRGVSEASIETAEFRVIKLEVLSDPGMQRISVSSDQTGDLLVLLEESNFTSDELDQVLEAFKKRKTIHMDISVARVNDTVRTAQVVQIGKVDSVQ